MRHRNDCLDYVRLEELNEPILFILMLFWPFYIKMMYCMSLSYHSLNIYFQIGGRSEVKDELVYRFIFPERPGALMNFLDTLSPRWNISLFHYRAQVCYFSSVSGLLMIVALYEIS
uniref:ACT-like domain-containing protein n=1 Tax=Triticum urartu TaxID=4572 RepID=A0A8R7RAP0_TRIUA